jgi:hypothetical protein
MSALETVEWGRRGMKKSYWKGIKRRRREFEKMLYLGGVTSVQTYPHGIDYSTADCAKWLALQEWQAGLSGR